MKIAIPPSLGISFLCIFLSSGLSVAPIFKARFLTKGVVIKLERKANKKTFKNSIILS